MENASKKISDSQMPMVSVNLAIYNSEKHIRQCLDSILTQTYPHESMEINILDNGSTDSTKKMIQNWKLEIGNWKFPKFSFIESKENLGMWPGQEELLNHSRGEYIVAISVDIILDKNFVKEVVRVLEKDPKIGAIQGKIFKYELADLEIGNWKLEIKTIDTCGFEMFRSRRIVNIGHGEENVGQFNQEKEIFAVEGAVPVFRKKTLEDIRIDGHFADPDYFWYGDDLDLAWRMRMFGWKQVYVPKAIAYHDRKTTKGLAGNKTNFIAMRKTVPLFKRRLDWRNTTLTIIKNDFAGNFWKDLPYIFWRQLKLWVYFLFFEPSMFIEIFKVAKLLPNMLKRRKEIMKKTRISAKEMRQWIL